MKLGLLRSIRGIEFGLLESSSDILKDGVIRHLNDFCLREL